MHFPDSCHCVWNTEQTRRGELCCPCRPRPVPSSLCPQRAGLICLSFLKTQNAFPSQGGCPRYSLCLALPEILSSGLRSRSKSHLLKTMQHNQTRGEKNRPVEQHSPEAQRWTAALGRKRRRGPMTRTVPGQAKVAPAPRRTRELIRDGSWSKRGSPNSNASRRQERASRPWVGRDFSNGTQKARTHKGRRWNSRTSLKLRTSGPLEK